MTLIIYLLMTWNIISSPAQVNDQIIKDNWQRLETEIVDDDILAI